MTPEFEARIKQIVAEWQEATRKQARYGHEDARYTERDKFVALDIRGSGAFLVEKASGLVYGIKGYGKVNYKKCSGSIYDPAFNGALLAETRFKYGNFDLTPVQYRKV